MLQSGQHQGTPGVPCRCASNSLPSGGMGHGMTMCVIQGGLPSEQTADRFASLFLYHALPVLASCGLASIKAHREYLAGAPLALSPSGGMGHGMKMSMTQEGLTSEQTGLWFASFFPYHALPVLASCGLASIKAHREYFAGAPQTLSPPGGWVTT